MSTLGNASVMFVVFDNLDKIFSLKFSWLN